ncbi:hypothetical protein [Umezawaea tangerina]|uniref:Fibronectin type-III domain-containing protein n=1 Tax=Umezawaea tangerina TaxID=84725 RepID=A0A2T0T495_9PSEU|nr:hypothetical protein [Umezawaea tangerina]PRY40496.1 hypothetical protein CLV43_106232 [Umezawaea tangerina]
MFTANAHSVSDTAISVHWHYTTEHAEGVETLTIEQRRSDGVGRVTSASPSPATSDGVCLFGDLDANVEYVYAVSATLTDGSSVSATATATTMPHPTSPSRPRPSVKAPFGLQVVDWYNLRATLTWKNGEGYGKVLVRVGDGTGVDSQIELDGSPTQYTTGRLTSGRMCRFAVKGGVDRSALSHNWDYSDWTSIDQLAPPGPSPDRIPSLGFAGLDAYWIDARATVGTAGALPGKGWGRALPITPADAASSRSDIAAVTRGSQVDLFWTGSDGAIGSTWAEPAHLAGEWTRPFPITPPGAAAAGSALAVVNRSGGGQLDMFWIGPDGAVASTWANPDGTPWHTPFPITAPHAARPGSPVAVVERGGGQLDVFWIGPDGAIGSTWADPDGKPWRPPFPITPPGAARSNSPLAAVHRGGGQLDVFWIGPDGAIGSTWADPDGKPWRPPFPITPPGAARSNSPLAAVHRGGGQLDVFWIGPDGAIGSTWANPGSGWQPPFPVTPSAATRGDSSLVAFHRGGGQLDVFWIGPDGAAASTWANPGSGWQPPFPVSPPQTARPGSPLAVVTR